MIESSIAKGKRENKMKTVDMKKMILKELPKPFKCNVSKFGLTIRISVDTKLIDGGWHKANELVYKLAKKLKLEEIGAGTDISTMIRDWEFINPNVDPNVEKTMISEAKNVIKTMKAFFKKYSNEYYASKKVYDLVEQMRVIGY